MMQKPSLETFRIEPTDLSKAKRVRQLLILLAIAWSVIGLAVGAQIGTPAWPLILLTVPPYGPFVFYYAAKAAVRFVMPSFGRVVAYETARERYERWWIRTQSDFWCGLSGRAFEAELANLYRLLGFETQLTSRGGDRGVDIWIVRNGRRVPVQCKAHRQPVTPGAARELYGTMLHFGASAGILASVSGFTRGVAEFAAGKGIELVDLPAVLQLQRKLE